MSAYNCVRIDFINGQSQYRFYDNPVSVKDYRYGEKSQIESDRIDKKIINHEYSPFGHGDKVEDIKILSDIEKAYRHNRSVSSSVNRTKTMIYNYARANEWEWFITLTFNKDKVNRYDYKECSNKLRKWLNNMRNRYAADLKYLIIPEQHNDGAWHFHGLFSNTGDIKFNKAFYKGTALPLLTKSGLQIFNFGSYKLGFSSATKIVDTAKASSYVTKYITKELAVNTVGHRRYYPSANLDLPNKNYFFISDDEKLEFLKEHKENITYNKEIRLKNGFYEQTVQYIEIGGNLDV